MPTIFRGSNLMPLPFKTSGQQGAVSSVIINDEYRAIFSCHGVPSVLDSSPLFPPALSRWRMDAHPLPTCVQSLEYVLTLAVVQVHASLMRAPSPARI